MSAKKSLSIRSRKTQRNWFIAACTIPTLLLFAIFMIYPTIDVFIMSFYRMGSTSLERDFIGLQNFKTLMQDSYFWQAFRNNIFFIIVVTVITMALALLFAALLNQTKLKEKPFYRIIFFFPNVLSVVIIGQLFVQIYDPNMGILNALFRSIHQEGLAHAWLGEEGTVLWAVAMAMIWQAVGYYMVMYMAGMDSIPTQLYEVADLEGMSKFRQFFSITVPLMWEIIRVTIVFFIISTINMSFVFVKVMTNGGPNGSSETLLTYMYKQAFTNSNFGYAMAVGVFIFLFSFVLALISNRLTKRETVQY